MTKYLVRVRAASMHPDVWHASIGGTAASIFTSKNTDGSNAVISFVDDRVIAKSQAGLK